MGGGLFIVDRRGKQADWRLSGLSQSREDSKNGGESCQLSGVMLQWKEGELAEAAWELA